MFYLFALALTACSGDSAAPAVEAPPAEVPAAAPVAAPDGLAPAAAPPGGVAPGPDAVGPSPSGGAAVVAPPPAGSDGAPSGGRPAPVGYPDSKAAKVQIGGTVSYDGKVPGVIRVDVLRNKGASERPELASTLELKAAGPWSMNIPGDAGTVAVVAFIDTNDNGPDPTEPRAEPVEFELKGAAVAGIVLSISDHAKQSKALADGRSVTPEEDPSPTTYAAPASASPGAQATAPAPK